MGRMKKRTWNSKWLLQSGFLLLLAVFIFHVYLLVARQGELNRMIYDIGTIQGGTQRILTLRLAGQENQMLAMHIDQTIQQLQEHSSKITNGETETRLDQMLYELSELWNEIQSVIQSPIAQEGDILEFSRLSERHFALTEQMMAQAEQYSSNVIVELRGFQTLLILLLLCGAGVGLRQYMIAIQLAQKNKELKAAAYLDKMTGIPGRRGCDEQMTLLEKQTDKCCAVMFDLNNLKQINDDCGHRTGDELIKAFAKILYQFAGEQVFVGRYGGDEFLMITKGYQEQELKRLLAQIQKEVEEFNCSQSVFQIDYACGYGFCTDSMAIATECADQNMYLNKRRMKEQKSVFWVANPEK